jgi:hypothetical protein
MTGVARSRGPSRAEGAAAPAQVHRRIGWSVVLPLCLIVAGAAARFELGEAPGSFDGASYSYVAWGMKEGWLRYLDVYENKGPLIYLLCYVLALVGAAPENISPLSSIVCDAALALIVGRIAWRWRGLGMALWVVAILAVDPFSLRHAFWGQTENLAAVCLMGSVLVAWPWFTGDAAAKTPRRALGAGGLLGLAYLAKQMVVLNVLGLVVALVADWFADGRRWREDRRAVGALVIGGLAPLAAFAGWLAATGRLTAAWQAQVVDLLGMGWRYGATDPAQRLADLAFLLGGFGPVVWPAMLAVAVAAAVGGSRPQRWLALLALAPLAAYTVTFDFYDHYLILALPALALLSGAALDGLFATGIGTSGRSPVRLLVAFLVGVAVVRVEVVTGADGRCIPLFEAWGEPVRALHALNAPDQPARSELQRVIDHVRARSAQSEPFIASSPQVYVLARQRCPTQWLYLAAMTAYLSGDNNEQFARDARRLRYLIIERTRLTPAYLPEDFVTEVRGEWAHELSTFNYWDVYRNPRFAPLRPDPQTDGPPAPSHP